MRRRLQALIFCFPFFVLVPQALGQVRKTIRNAATPTVLVSQLKQPRGCLVDATDVYWLEAGYKIMRVGKNGGGPVMVVSDDKILGYTLDGMNIYFLTENDLKRVSISGGPSKTLATTSKNLDLIALDETSVYWLAYKDGESGQLMKVAKDGADSILLASHIYYAKGLLVDDKYVYWADYADDTLRRIDKSGGQSEILAKLSGFNLSQKYMSAPEHIAADQSSIYWACVIGCIVKIDKKTGLAYGLLPEQPFSGGRMIVDDTNLYWSSPYSNRIIRMSKNGGRPVTLAARLNSPSSIALDEKYVYWTDGKRGLILKIVK